MSDLSSDHRGVTAEHAQHAEIVEPGGEPPEASESVSSPAKVMRTGSMVKQLVDEVRAASLDEAGRDRLKLIYEQSVEELS